MMDHFPSRVLLAIDGSEGAARAARAAVDLSRLEGAELHVVHVWHTPHPPSFIGPAPGYYESWRSGYEQEAEELLAEQVKRIRGASRGVAGVHLKEGRPPEGISELADRFGADLIVVGSRGLGAIKQLVLGSVSEGVVHLAPCSVLVMRGGDEAWPPSRVVVGVDLSEEAKSAAKFATSLGKDLGAPVLLVLAYPKLPVILRDERSTALASDDEVRHQASAELQRLAGSLEEELGYRSQTRVVRGDPAGAIEKVAEESGEPTLVVVGSRGLDTLRRTVMGSVSTNVLRAASGPVLITKSSRSPIPEK
jgi:nucleotide-binding universal stress UspA family protein